MPRRQGHPGRRRGAGDRRLPQVPRDRAEGAAARRGDAPPRRPRDGRRRQPAAPPAREAEPDYKAAIARYQEFLKALSEGSGQRPRALPAGARPRAGRRPRDGAEDARPAGRRRTRTRATATRRSSAAASCCSRRATTPKAEKAFATVLARRPGQRRTTTARSTCRAGRCSSRGGSRTRCSRSSPCSTSRSAAGSDEGRASTTSTEPDARRPRAGRGHLPRRPASASQNLQGAESIPAYIDSDDAQGLRVPRLRAARRAVHQAGARPRTRPTPSALSHAAAAARAGAAAAGARDRDLRAGRLRHAGARREEGIRGALRHRQRVPQAPTPRAGSKAQPLVKTHLTELARHYHASAQKSKAQRRLPGSGALVPRATSRSFPDRPGGARRTTSCSPSCCTRTSASPRPRIEYEKTAYGYPAHAKSADAGYAALLAYAEQEKRAARGRAAGAAARQRRQRAALRRRPSRPTRAPARC